MKNALVSAFLGFMGAALFHVLKPDQVIGSQVPSVQVLTASGINIVDSKGRIRMQLGFSKEGPPGIWVMDEKGTPRIVFGLYQDESSYFGLQDKNGQMIELMRSVGSNETPLLIFKNGGADKMITGLNSKAEPFLMYMDNSKSTNLFGKYAP
jgi:hypothetical protein